MKKSKPNPTTDNQITITGLKIGVQPNRRLIPEATNQTIQLDYMSLISNLQEATRLLREENALLQEKMANQGSELDQLRVRLLRLEAEVNRKPPFKLVRKKQPV